MSSETTTIGKHPNDKPWSKIAEALAASRVDAVPEAPGNSVEAILATGKFQVAEEPVAQEAVTWSLPAAKRASTGSKRDKEGSERRGRRRENPKPAAPHPPNPTFPPLIHPTFQAFDSLPDSAFISLLVVCALLDCSPATVWRRVRSGQLVAPHRIGARATRWQVGELRCHLAGLMTVGGAS